MTKLSGTILTFDLHGVGADRKGVRQDARNNVGHRRVLKKPESHSLCLGTAFFCFGVLRDEVLLHGQHEPKIQKLPGAIF